MAGCGLLQICKGVEEFRHEYPPTLTGRVVSPVLPEPPYWLLVANDSE